MRRCEVAKIRQRRGFRTALLVALALACITGVYVTSLAQDDKPYEKEGEEKGAAHGCPMTGDAMSPFMNADV